MQVRRKCGEHWLSSPLRLLCLEISELKWAWDWNFSIQNVLLNSSGEIIMRWMRNLFSLFLPVLAFVTSILFGRSIHQKPLTVLLFWTAWLWKLQIKMIFQHLLIPAWQKCKIISRISKLGTNPTWYKSSWSFQTAWIGCIYQWPKLKKTHCSVFPALEHLKFVTQAFFELVHSFNP